MWFRLGTFAVKDGQGAALVETYNTRAAPKVRASPGNRGCAILEPATPGAPFVVITVWENRAAGEAYEASGTAAEVVGMVRAYFAGPPTLQSYLSSSEF
jgi:heme-degrading monooxygenase HmoA